MTSPDQQKLVNAKALITGASQGLGRAIAHQFLAQGADVILSARTMPELDATAAQLAAEFSGRTILAQTCDIGRAEDIDALFTVVERRFPDLDIVVNNAGIHGPIGALDDNDWAHWRQAIEVNLLGTVYSCRRAIEFFKARSDKSRRKKIVNLSGGGATGPQPGLTAYGASKAGLVRFTETLAAEVQSFGIDVNAVAPGALATRLTQELASAGPGRIGETYHARVEATLAQGGMPMEHAANLCVYLASAQSDGITGRLLSAAWDPWPFSDERRRDIADSDIYTLRRIVPKDRGKGWGDA